MEENWTNVFYNELTEVYYKLKNLCIGMCRNTFSGKCDHRLLHEFDFESVFEVKMTMRRLLAHGKLFG